MKPRPFTYAWQYAALGIYLVFIVTPVGWLFSMAFKGPREALSLHQSIIPREPTLQNFTMAITEQPLLRAALNSVLVASSTAVLTVVLAIPAAYLMARYRGVPSRVVMLWVLLSQMFPFILILIPLFLAAIQMGLYNSLVGLVLIYTVWNLPFAMWMLRNFIAGIPIDLEEQAATDGASRLMTLRQVVAPLLVPGIATSLMFTFINSWNEFFFALVLIKDQQLAPLSLMLVRFIGIDGAVRLGPLAAASLLATIPTLGFFAAIQGRLTSGLVSGAVKG